MTPGARFRPNRPRRFVSALLGALVLLLGAPQDGYGLRPCAHHEQGDAGGGHVHSEESPGTSGESCTCVGTCHASGATPAAPSERLSLLLLEGAALEGADPVEVTRLSTPTAFLLPYANGPPVS